MTTATQNALDVLNQERETLLVQLSRITRAIAALTEEAPIPNLTGSTKYTRRDLRTRQRIIFAALEGCPDGLLKHELLAITQIPDRTLSNDLTRLKNNASLVGVPVGFGKTGSLRYTLAGINTTEGERV